MLSPALDSAPVDVGAGTGLVGPPPSTPPRMQPLQLSIVEEVDDTAEDGDDDPGTASVAPAEPAAAGTDSGPAHRALGTSEPDVQGALAPVLVSDNDGALPVDPAIRRLLPRESADVLEDIEDAGDAARTSEPVLASPALADDPVASLISASADAAVDAAVDAAAAAAASAAMSTEQQSSLIAPVSN